MISEKWRKWLKFLGGFLGWFASNTLAYVVLNHSLNDIFTIVGGIGVLIVNVVLLTVFVILKGTRWITLGIIGALAVNFTLATGFLTATDIDCFTPDTSPTKTPSTGQKPIGFHDGNFGKVISDQCTAFGWAVDPDDRTIDLKIRVLSDGQEVTRGVANRYRPDLNVPEGCPGGTCGYEFYLWKLITPGTLHAIRVQAQDPQTGQWHNLSNTPKVIECSVSE